MLFEFALSISEQVLVEENKQYDTIINIKDLHNSKEAIQNAEKALAMAKKTEKNYLIDRYNKKLEALKAQSP